MKRILYIKLQMKLLSPLFNRNVFSPYFNYFENLYFSLNFFFLNMDNSLSVKIHMRLLMCISPKFTNNNKNYHEVYSH